MTTIEPSQSRSGLREIRYRCSEQFLPILRHLNASLLVSTYQAGKVAVVAAEGEEVSISFVNFDQPMGLAISPKWLAVGTKRQIWLHRAAHDLAAQLNGTGASRACYIARSSHVTGSFHVNDIGWGREICSWQRGVGSQEIALSNPACETLWLVNTLFSCLVTLDGEHSFVPRWRPPFVTDLAAEDRCHLNGLALEEGYPKYVTALARTNEREGWRPTKAESGCVLDVASGEAVTVGLCMPHSPRMRNSRLWLLNSGRGEINVVDVASGRVETVDRVPGYTRGLSFAGQFAFVGMSKIRETTTFGGLPIGERPDDLRCGVAVVDLVSGRSVAWFEFVTGVDEIFDVQAVSGYGKVILRGLHLEEDEEQELWIVPPLPPA